MITEDYVSFETAKLLKEKGFNSKCIAYYLVFNENIKFYECNNLGQSLPYISNDNWTIILRNPLESGYATPTLQMAMKWLREVHNIHISVYVFNRELPITNVPIFYTCDIATEKLSSQQGHLRGAWKSYEEACESAIKYCLENLI